MDPDMKYIDMFDQLEISDYYTTDLHWDQSKIVKIAEFLGTEMGFADRLDKEYTSKELSPFYGVYYGQAALTIAPDKLTYLTNENFDSLKVSLFDTKKLEYYEAEMYNHKLNFVELCATFENGYAMQKSTEEIKQIAKEMLDAYEGPSLFIPEAYREYIKRGHLRAQNKGEIVRLTIF